MSTDILVKNYDLRTTPKIIFESLYDSEKARQWFPTIQIIHNNETINIEKLKIDGIEYVARIQKAIPYSSIEGTIESLDGKNKQDFEWIITPNEAIKNWTRLTTKTKPNQRYARWISPLPVVGATIGLSAFLEKGFLSMTSTYATSVASSAPILTPIASHTASANTAGTTTSISKTLLTVMVLSTVTIAGVGAVMIDAYYSDPYVEYYLTPQQLPADLHGTSLIITDIFSTDDKNIIVDYTCNNESIIHGFEYALECIIENSFGNKETVTVIVPIKKPNNYLGTEATDCISQHYLLSDSIIEEYPYLLNLPNLSPSRLSSLQNNHIKLLDEFYENHDYVSAKKHATIVLKYFSNNDIQTLSTIGNLIRDENRNDISNVSCSIAIHSTPFISHTVWGKISLAEDYHVLGDYETSIHWSSQVIDDYDDNPNIHEDSYVNALIIKANALYRLNLEQLEGFEDAKNHYNAAHNIHKSYDTWFGLGNIDRHEGKFEDAKEKYLQARLLADDTKEINEAIQSLPHVFNQPKTISK